MPKFHDYIIIIFILQKCVISCAKPCASFLFCLKENTNNTNSIFSRKKYYFGYILVIIYFSFYFKGNTKATIWFVFRFYFCKKSTSMCLFLHILKSAIVMYIVCKFFIVCFVFSFSFFLKGNTNATNSSFLIKICYFDFLVSISFYFFIKGNINITNVFLLRDFSPDISIIYAYLLHIMKKA